MAFHAHHPTALAAMKFEDSYESNNALRNHIKKELLRLPGTKHLNHKNRSRLAEPIRKLALETKRTKIASDEPIAGASSPGEENQPSLGFAVPPENPLDDASEDDDVEEVTSTASSRLVSDKVPRSAKNLGLDPEIFFAYGPPIKDNEVMSWEHPVPFIGIGWGSRTQLSRQKNHKDYEAKLKLDNIYDLLGFRDVKPHSGETDDHPKGVTCWFCQHTFFGTDIAIHFQEIFQDFEAKRPMELEGHISRDEIDRWRSEYQTANSDDARFTFACAFITQSVLKKFESGQPVVPQYHGIERHKLIQDISKSWYNTITRRHFSITYLIHPQGQAVLWRQKFDAKAIHFSPRLGSNIAICAEIVAATVRQLLKTLCDSLGSFDTVLSAKPLFIDAKVENGINPAMPLSFPKAECAGLTAIYLKTAHGRYIVPVQMLKTGPRPIRLGHFLNSYPGWFYPSTMARLGRRFDHAHIIVAQDAVLLSTTTLKGHYLSRRYADTWYVAPYTKAKGADLFVNSGAIRTRSSREYSFGPGGPWIWMARSVQFLLDICTMKGNEVNWGRAEPSEFEVIKLDDVQFLPNPGAELLNVRAEAATAKLRVVRHYLFQKPELQRNLTPEQFNSKLLRKCKISTIKGEGNICAGSAGKDGHVPCPTSSPLNACTAYLYITKGEAQAAVPKSCTPCIEILMPFKRNVLSRGGDSVIGADVDGKPSCAAFTECQLPQVGSSGRCLYHQEWEEAPRAARSVRAEGLSLAPLQPPREYIRTNVVLQPDEMNSLEWLRDVWSRKDPKVWVLDTEFLSLVSGKVLPYEIAIRNLDNKSIIHTMINYQKTLFDVIEGNKKYMSRTGEPSKRMLERARATIEQHYEVPLANVTPGMTASEIRGELIKSGLDEDSVILTYGLGDHDATILNSLLCSVGEDIDFLTNSMTANLLMLLRRLLKGMQNYKLGSVHERLCQGVTKRLWHKADEDVIGMIEIMEQLFILLEEVKPAGLP